MHKTDDGWQQVEDSDLYAEQRCICTLTYGILKSIEGMAYSGEIDLGPRAAAVLSGPGRQAWVEDRKVYRVEFQRADLFRERSACLRLVPECKDTLGEHQVSLGDWMQAQGQPIRAVSRAIGVAMFQAGLAPGVCYPCDIRWEQHDMTTVPTTFGHIRITPRVVLVEQVAASPPSSGADVPMGGN